LEVPGFAAGGQALTSEELLLQQQADRTASSLAKAFGSDVADAPGLGAAINRGLIRPVIGAAKGAASGYGHAMQSASEGVKAFGYGLATGEALPSVIPSAQAGEPSAPSTASQSPAQDAQFLKAINESRTTPEQRAALALKNPAATPPAPSASSATGAFEPSALHFGKQVDPRRATDSDLLYNLQLEKAGGRMRVGSDGTFQGYEMPTGAATPQDLARQVNDTYTPAQQEARRAAAFSPENVAKQIADAKAHPGLPDFYNGMDVRGLGPAEYMALKNQTGAEQVVQAAAQRYYGLPQAERGSPTAAVTRAMAPGPSGALQFGMAADARAREGAAEAQKLQAGLLGEQIKAGAVQSKTDAAGWDKWQSGFNSQVERLTKAPANADPGAEPPADEGQKQFVIEAGNFMGEHAHKSGGVIPIQPYATTAAQLLQYARQNIPTLTAARAQATADLKGKGSPADIDKQARKIIADKIAAARLQLGLPG
jgi:hypothetical protein